MKKIISIFISLVLVIYGFTGCIDDKSSVSPPPDEMARLQSVSVMECFENEDIEGLKSMFCKRVIDNIDLNSQIEGAFEFIKGKIISYDAPDGTSGGGLIKDGERVELILSGKITNIKTDKGDNIIEVDKDSYIYEVGLGITEDWIFYLSSDDYNDSVLKRKSKDGKDSFILQEDKQEE